MRESMVYHGLSLCEVILIHLMVMILGEILVKILSPSNEKKINFNIVFLYPLTQFLIASTKDKSIDRFKWILRGVSVT